MTVSSDDDALRELRRLVISLRLLVAALESRLKGPPLWLVWNDEESVRNPVTGNVVSLERLLESKRNFVIVEVKNGRTTTIAQ